MTKEKPILLTSALPYANGPIHVGHMLEYIQTDIYARFLRLIGKDVVYVCADDTHGTPIEVNAAKQGKTPQEFVKKWYSKHKKDMKDYGIKLDSFYTTDSKESKHFTELIFSRLKHKKYIYKKEIELMYCLEDERFLPDRYIKGICPKCGAKDQYGDVCEVCGASYQSIDVMEPKCVLCGNTPVRKLSEHYFFKLSKFSGKLKEYLEKNDNLQPEVRNQILTWINEGLEDWCISRDAPYFGFKIPGEEEKYFYVWLDAPVGYISSLANYLDGDVKKAENFWNNSRILHFIGKDIIYFHLLFWPAVLLGSSFNVPENVVVHGFINVNGEKMSKSRGTFITANEFKKAVDPHLLRYYFASNLTHTMNDIDLEIKNFKAKINNELVSNIANFVYRTLSFTNKNFSSKLGKTRDKRLLEEIEKKTEEIKLYYKNFDYRNAVRSILEISDLGNKYFQNNKPWELVKENKGETQKILTDCANIAKILSVVVKPVLPKYSASVEKQLGLKNLTWDDISKRTENHKIGKARIVLKKLEEVELKLPEPKDKDEKNPFSKLNLKVGKIKSVSEHYNADKLLLINVDLGKDSKQLVAGLKPYYPDTEELVGKKIVVLTNLEHANLRGEKSEGMLLAAETKDSKTVEILEVKGEPGDQVFIEGIKPQKKTIQFDDFMDIEIYVKDNKVMYKDKQLQSKKGKIKTKKVEDGKVR